VLWQRFVMNQTSIVQQFLENLLESDCEGKLNSIKRQQFHEDVSFLEKQAGFLIIPRKDMLFV
jgi:hypothetical protein